MGGGGEGQDQDEIFSTLIFFVGTVRGIRCTPAMRKRITDTVHREFSEFLPKVDPSFYR